MRAFRSIAMVAAAVLIFSGIAYAASVNNYFSRTTPGTKDNVLTLNGTVKVEDVTLPVAASFVVGTEASNNIDVQVTFKDGAGTAIAVPFQTYCWISEDSAGAAYATTAGTSAFSAVTNGSVESVTSGKSANVISSAAGLLGVRLTQTSGSVPDEYLCCTSGVGVPLCSGAVDFE